MDNVGARHEHAERSSPEPVTEGEIADVTDKGGRDQRNREAGVGSGRVRIGKADGDRDSKEHEEDEQEDRCSDGINRISPGALPG